MTISPWNYAKDDSEHSHQVALFMWVAAAKMWGFEKAWSKEWWESRTKPRSGEGGQGTSKGGRELPASLAVPGLNFLFAIPNGGQRDARVAARLKAEGVKPGVSDLFLPVPCGQYYGLWVEMKKPGGRPSPEQVQWGTDMSSQGYAFHVCDSWEKAARVIEAYITLS